MKPELPWTAPAAVTRDTLLVLLPEDPAGAVEWWRVGADGRCLEAGTGVPGRGDAAQYTAGGGYCALRERVVVAVVGAGCRVRWVEVRAHSRAQAAAAARAGLAGELAGADGDLHIVVAPDGAERWLTVVASMADMQGWLQRTRAMGLDPEHLVPVALLLPTPAADRGDPPEIPVTVATHGGAWVCRGPDLAFSAEAALARTVLARRPTRTVPLTGATLAAGALAPAVNLLQDSFAPAGDAPQGAATFRRAAVLGGLVLALLLFTPGIRAAIDHWRAGQLENTTTLEARSALPGLPAGADAPAILREHLAATRNVRDFSAALGGLLASVEAAPGISLDALSWNDGRLQATVAHGGPADVQALRGQLEARGFALVEEGVDNGAGGPHLRLSLEPAP